jgi:hypothetical protein
MGIWLLSFELIGMHALLIAAFASRENRGRPQALRGPRVNPGAGYCGCVLGPRAIADADTNADSHTDPVADSEPDAYGHQF